MTSPTGPDHRWGPQDLLKGREDVLRAAITVMQARIGAAASTAVGIGVGIGVDFPATADADLDTAERAFEKALIGYATIIAMCIHVNDVRT